MYSNYPEVTATNCVQVLSHAHRELDRQPHNEELQQRFLQVWAEVNQNYPEALGELYDQGPHVLECDGAEIVRKYQAIPAPRVSTHSALTVARVGALFFDARHENFQGRTRDGKHLVIVSPTLLDRASTAQSKMLRAQYDLDNDRAVYDHWRELLDADFWYRFALDWVSLAADGWPDDVLEVPTVFGDIRIFAVTPSAL